ncbi:MAG TPA: hypothetical protein VFO72_03785 [Pyrinomonadaceae bacterium]|nr:hypothetical protein [Pyrinomonadaceae bacterium]
MWKKLAPCLLVIFCAVPCAQAQTDKEGITIVLVGNRTVVVDEVSESSDGYWYKRGNVTTFLDRERVVRVEYPKPPEAPAGSEPLEGTGKWRLTDAQKIQDFFLAKFKKRLPTTAFGQSDLHTRWGLDHRNGMDVGLHPDSTEGRALIEFLRDASIPFLAFRGPVPGVATGPHIHIGNRSARVSGR